MATGADPGGHGGFDFAQRDPDSDMPYVSILPVRKNKLGEQNQEELEAQLKGPGYL